MRPTPLTAFIAGFIAFTLMTISYTVFYRYMAHCCSSPSLREGGNFYAMAMALHMFFAFPTVVSAGVLATRWVDLDKRFVASGSIASLASLLSLWRLALIDSWSPRASAFLILSSVCISWTSMYFIHRVQRRAR